MTYRLIDLFSGAGGMSLGFVATRFGGGFECAFSIDNDAAAVRTHARNFETGEAHCYDIEQWLREGKTVPAADVVIGGPPCQGFSLLNKQREGDKRRALWEPYMDIVRLSGARMFVIENVPGLIASAEYDQIRARADAMGFDTLGKVLNTADYGVPQTRRRAIIVGWKRGAVPAPDFPPSPSHAEPGTATNRPAWLTVLDAIGDLGSPVGTEIRAIDPPDNLHFGRNPTKMSMERYRAVPIGGNRFDLLRNRPDITPECWIKKKSGSTDLFGRLWWNRPSVTIRTEFYKPEKGRYLHPDQDRPITHREAARLMGFPDYFQFEGSKIEVARQIGNAVPPPFAGVLSKMIRGCLDAASGKLRLLAEADG